MKTTLSILYAFMLMCTGISIYAQDSTNLNPTDEFTYTDHTAKVGEVESTVIPKTELDESSDTTPATRASNSGIGETEGSLSVSLTGGANYKVPIAVPPGINGVEPDVAISYDSHAGNGLAGWGWNVSGLSTITRIPSTQYHDGEIDPVDFDSMDRFALDGERLILKSGTYGGNGAVYQTEKYSNLRITSHGVSSFGANYGPSYFIVMYPDGSKAHYGITQSSRSRLEYGISYWDNPQGLRISYSYTMDGNVLQISRINYGAKGNTTLVINQITFGYVNRTRSEYSYIQGIKFTRKKLLKTIKVSSNGTGYRNYYFTHKKSSLGYDRIEYIQEHTGDSTLSHSRISFSYINHNDVTPFSVDYVPTTANLGVVNIAQNNSQAVPLDFTGNGKMDFMVYPNTKDKFWFFQGTNYTRPTTVNTGRRFQKIFPTTHLNHQNKILEGQGFTVVQNSGNKVKFKVYGKAAVASGVPVGVQYEKIWSVPTYNIASSCGAGSRVSGIPQEYISGDFNGDGLTDVVAIGKPYSERFCRQILPCDIVDDPQPIAGGTTDLPTTSVPETNINDVNTSTTETSKNPILIGGGGGRNCCECSTTRNRSGTVTFINLDRRKTSGFTTIAGSLGRSLGASDRILSADVNGDGKMDILLFTSGKVYAYTLNKTNSLQQLWQTNSSYIKNDFPIYLGDYNGDGKTDFMTPTANGSRVFRTFISSGVNFVSTSDTFSFTFKVSHSAGGTAHGYNLFPVDINGDGKTDIIEHSTTTFNGNPAAGKQTVAVHRNFYAANTTKLVFRKAGQKIQQGNLYHFPIPIFLSSDQPNYALEFATISNKYIHSFRQNQDHREEVALSSIGNNGVYYNIKYSNLDPQDHINGAIYTKGNSQVYPYVDIAVASGVKLVREINRYSGSTTTTIKQGFYYHGAVSHMGGLGFSGFQKVARSNWHSGRGDRSYNNISYNIALNGAVIDEYQTPYDYRFGSIPSDYIYKIRNVYNHSLSSNKVWKLAMTSSTTQNRLDGTYTTSHFQHDRFNNVIKETINYSGQASVVTVKTLLNNTGSPYYIGRLRYRKVESKIGAQKFTTKEIFYHTGRLLTGIHTQGSDTEKNVKTYTHDSYGNITKIISKPFGSFSRTKSFTYDNSARFVIKATDPEGLETKFTYDRVTGNLKTETNPFNFITSYEYDKWNRVTKVTDYTGNSNTTTYKESQYNYTITQLSSDGSSSSSQYDRLKRKINDRVRSHGGQWIQNTYEYDKFDRPYRQSEPHFGNAPSQWNTNEYDFYGRIKRQTLHTGKVINYSYNKRSTTVDDGTKTVTTIKNALGKTVRVDDPGGTINYTYFGNGNLKSTTYAGSTQTIEQDGWGRKTKLTDPSAGVYTYTYNGFGQLIREGTPKGHSNNWYSRAGRLEKTRISGAKTDMTTNYNYDSATKQLVSIIATDAVNSKTHMFTYKYDHYHRPLSVSENTGTANFNKKFQYDQYGRIKAAIYDATTAGKSSSSQFDYTYDSYGNATGITDWEIKSKNARGQIGKIELGTNQVEEMLYDTYGFIKKISIYNPFNSYNYIDLSYKFNPKRGTLTSRTHKTDIVGHSSSYAQSFNYDSQDRLTEINGPFAKTHAYDNFGRITNNSKIGAMDYFAGKYRYLIKELTLNTAGSQFYKNRVGQQITYNAFKKPVDIWEEGKGRVNFEYGPMRNRTNAWYGGLESDKNERRYHKQYSSIIPAEIVQDKEKNTYKFIFFNGGDAYSAPIAKIEKYTNNTSDGGAKYHLHRDYQGSILNITKKVKVGPNTVLELHESRQFGAWGTVDAFWSKNSKATMGSESLLDRGYTGHEHFESVGLIHMNGRMYDPQLGRFLSPDNYIQNPYNTQNFNRYGYVLNNPLMYTDPSGEMTEDEGGGNGWGLAAAAASITQSLRGARIGSWLGTNFDSFRSDFDRAVDDVREWVRGWFGKAPEKINFAQTQVMSDPLMNPNPGVASVFSSNGGISVLGLANYVGGLKDSFKQGFNDRVVGTVDFVQDDLFRGDYYTGALYNGTNALFAQRSLLAPSDEYLVEIYDGLSNMTSNDFAYAAGYSTPDLALTAGASGAVRGAAGLLRTATRGASTTARLQRHVTRAAREVDRLGNNAFTRRQRAALNKNPYLKPMFRGNRIDVMARDFIKNDRRLSNLRGSYNNGPDFANPFTGEWWDITTPGAWSGHVRKYGPGGTLLNTHY